MPLVEESYVTEYVFRVSIEGQQALKQAEKFREEFRKMLSGGDVVFLERQEKLLAGALEAVNAQITSQTRRFSYNRRRLAEVGAEIDKLIAKEEQLAAAMSRLGIGAFDQLVGEARKASQEVVGQSIIPDMVTAIIAWLQELRRAQVGIFGRLPKEAAEAAIRTSRMMRYKMEPMTTKEAAAFFGVTTGTVRRWAREGMIEAHKTMEDEWRIWGRQVVTMAAGKGKYKAPFYITPEEYLGKPRFTEKDIGLMKRFNIQLNAATLQYFGLRRLAFQFVMTGRSIEQMGRAALTFLGGVAKQFLELNEVATRAAAAMDLPRELMGALGKAVIETSKSMGLFRPTELAEGLRLWAAGTGEVIQSEEQLNRLVENTVDIQWLAILNAENLGETMTNVGAIMKTFGMTVDDVGRVASVLNYVAARTFATVGDLGEAFRFIGPTVAQLGVSFEETAAALAVLADANIRGSMAGRALRQMFVRLHKSTDEYEEAMNEVLSGTLELGETWRDIVFPEGKFMGLAEYIDMLAASTENMTDAQKGEFVAILATANELPALTALIERQVSAREYGVNAIRAYKNIMRGFLDEEAFRFKRWIEDITGLPFALEDAQRVIGEMIVDMEAAPFFLTEQIARKWEAAMIDIGSAVSQLALGPLEMLAGLLTRIADFVAKNPQVVGALGLVGVGGVILGTLMRIVGQTAGAVANILIMRMAFTGFSVSVKEFWLAVQEFSVGIGAKAAVGTLPSLVATAPAWLQTALRWIVPATVAAVAAYLGLRQLRKPPSGELPPSIILMPSWRQQQMRRRFMEEELAVRERFLEAYKFLPEPAAIFTRRMDEAAEAIPGATRPIISSLEDLDAALRATAQSADVLADGIIAQVARFAGPRVVLGLTAEQAELFRRGAKGPPLYAEEELRAVYEEEKYQRDVQDVIDRYEKERIAQGEAYRQQVAESTEAYQLRRLATYRDFFVQEEQAHRDHIGRLAGLEESFGIQVASIREGYLERVAKIEESYRERIEKIRAGALSSEEKALVTHGDRIAELTERYNTKIADYEADFRKRMQRMELDHQERMSDLIRTRDARGLLTEMRSYRRRVRESEEDRRDYLSRAARDYQTQLKKLQEALDKQRAAAKKSLEDQLAEAKKNYEKQLAEAKRNYDKQLQNAGAAYGRQRQAQIEAYNEARRVRETDLQERVDAMDQDHKNELEKLEELHKDRYEKLVRSRTDELWAMREAHYEKMARMLGWATEDLDLYSSYLNERLDLLKSYLVATQLLWAGALPPGYKIEIPEEWAKTWQQKLWEQRYGASRRRQTGGYMTRGLYQVGEQGREFALDAPTTRAMERWVGPLTQERVLAGGRPIIVLDQRNWTFQGSFTAADKLWFQQAARESAYRAFDEVLTEVQRG